jgi:hypothetical protein
MSQKDKVLGIIKKALEILNLGLDIIDPSVRSVPACKYHEIRKAAQQIREEAQELP